jgi:hypothetical protein
MEIFIKLDTIQDFIENEELEVIYQIFPLTYQMGNNII